MVSRALVLVMDEKEQGTALLARVNATLEFWARDREEMKTQITDGFQRIFEELRQLDRLRVLFDERCRQEDARHLAAVQMTASNHSANVAHLDALDKEVGGIKLWQQTRDGERKGVNWVASFVAGLVGALAALAGVAIAFVRVRP